MYNHNAPPLANLGPVLNNGNSQNGGSGNWNESQRMRGKIRYGSRNANNSRHQNQQQQHSNNSSSGYGGSSIPQINNMKTSGVPVNNMVLNQNSSPSPRGNQHNNQLVSTLGRSKGSRRQNRNRMSSNNSNSNTNNMDLNVTLQSGLNSGNVGAGGSIYLDNQNDQQLGQMSGSKQQVGQAGKYAQQQNQMLPRIGSSQQNKPGPLVKRNSDRNSAAMQHQSNNNSQNSGMPNLYGNRENRASPTPMPGMLSPSRSNNQLNSSQGHSQGQVQGQQTQGQGHGGHGLSSGSHSIKGYKPSNPHNWTNQDNFFILENTPYGNNSQNNIYCVLDGHGEHGHIVSKRCTELLPQLLTSKNCQLAPVQGGGINYYYDYKRAFLGTQSDLNNNTHTIVDASCSGATCVLININLTDGVIITANAGDSRAVIASSKRNSQGGQVSFIATALSYDHKPDRQDERKRILACNGRVGCRQMAVPNSNRVSVPNASGGSSIPSMISVPVGPCRVWYSYKGDTLGLAMSRSIGDCVVHQSGVSAEPELVVYKLNNGVSDGHGHVLTDEFVVLATDGIWDVLDNNTVVQLIVQNFINPSNGRGNWSASDAAAFICKTARAKWEKLSPMIDDITAIVVRLN